MDRRTLLALGLAATALPEMSFAQVAPEVIPLWPGTPPGGEGLHLVNRLTPPVTPAAMSLGRGLDQVGMPDLTVYRPEKPDGSALILAPGGGYAREMVDLEGADVARRFNGAGVTCFVLAYRLPGEGWARHSDVPLQDAQRAMRLVRANAARYGIDPARIGFMGFSAGGHLAASIATRFAARVYAPVDAADAQDARPSFAVPMYPVITMGPGAHIGSRDHLLGPDASAALIAAYSCEKNIPADTPPTFMALAADDDVVPPLPNGVAMFTALRAAGIPAALHVFEEGGHGFAIKRAVGHQTAIWPELVLQWGAHHGYFRNA